jgi:hypothetical protein
LFLAGLPQSFLLITSPHQPLQRKFGLVPPARGIELKRPMAGRKSELCRAGGTRIRWELRDQAAVLGDEIASGIPCPRNDEGKSFVT